ncbi:MAG: LysR family transcriptional regulator [Oceanospirillaceae bacterium]|nr:LysR family transcriptional regulator [Oceanospirillaceae bacterium]
MKSMTDGAPVAPDYIPNIRRLRAMVAVAESGSVIGAAESLHLAQPTVSRAISNLESELGQALFERHRSGMRCTAAGDIVLRRFQRVLHHLEEADRSLPQEGQVKRGRLAQHISYRQMRVLVTLANLHSEALAARQLSLGTAAIGGHLRELEKKLGLSLFLRTRQGLKTTECGVALARHIGLALRELIWVPDDLAAWHGQSAGRLVIGAMPFAGSLLVPQAVSQLLKEFPGISVSILDGTYDALMDALHKGEIDILVGVLGGGQTPQGISEVNLYTDRLTAVARRDHPLAACASLKLSDLLEAQWIAPRLGSPARRRFDEAFLDAGLTPPEVAVESGNLVALHTLLLDSDRITLITPTCAALWDRQLAILPVPISGGSHSISYYRCDAQPTSPTLDRFCHLLATVAQSLEPADGAVL